MMRPSGSRGTSDAAQTLGIDMVSVYNSHNNAIAILALLGERLGGAYIVKATMRVNYSGVLAMALTARVGTLLGPMR